MTHQLLHMFLYLRSKLLIGAGKQPEEVAQELGDGAVLHVLAARVLQSPRHAAPAVVAAPVTGRGLLLQTDAAQGHQEAGHVGPLGLIVL